MPKLSPPVAERRQHADTDHGITREDPYHWLRADNWQEVMQAPETLPADIRAYLDAENAYFAAEFEEPHAALSEKIFKEIRGRIKEDDSGVPTPDGPWAYNSRMLEGKQYPLIVRAPRGGGDETVLLDCNIEAEGLDYFGFGGASHSPDHSHFHTEAGRVTSSAVMLRPQVTSTPTTGPSCQARIMSAGKFFSTAPSTSTSPPSVAGGSTPGSEIEALSARRSRPRRCRW